MAQTAGGTYYAASSELVSSWPATSLNLANQLESRFAAKCGYVKQATAPTGAYGLIWDDSSTTPPTTKKWDGSAWVSFSSRATYSAVTGSPAISTVGGKTIIRWTGNGSITITSGIIQYLVAAGGGYGKSAYTGGGGGSVITGDAYLTGGTYNIVVGAKGGNTVDGSRGGYSGIGTSLVAAGGSRAASNLAGNSTYPGDYGNGSGGGAGGAGLANGTGGPGITSTIADGSTPVEYGKGGTWGGTTASPANTGKGGDSGTPQAGSDGVVIIAIG